MVGWGQDRVGGLVQRPKVGKVPLHQVLARNQAVFDYFGPSIHQSIHTQCLKVGVVIDAMSRIVVETDTVFDAPKIDGAFATVSGIHHGQKGGRHRNPRDSSFEHGSGHGTHIAEGSTSKNQENRGAIGLLLHQPSQNLLQGIPGFGGFAGFHDQEGTGSNGTIGLGPGLGGRVRQIETVGWGGRLDPGPPEI